MWIEKFQNDETKEVSQNVSSFEKIRQKVIKLNNEEYKWRTYNVWIRSSLWFPIPYVWVKNKKIKLQSEQPEQSEQPQYIKASEKDDFYTSVWVWYGKMSKKERKRFESDKQEMNQLISDLSDLYWLNQLISDLNKLYLHSPYVNEENGKVVINFAPNVQIICDWEKAVLQRDGKIEKEFRLRTPEEINEWKMINSQKVIKKHDEAQKNEWDLAEQQIDDALKGLE